MSTHYSGGGYNVTIAKDGAILVRSGDTLSKYSMAIHNDFKHIHEYGRMNGGSSVKPVDNVNLIYAGETLYHIPTRNSQPGVPQNPAPTKPLTPREKQALLEQLKHEYNLKGDQLVVTKRLIDSGRLVQGGTSLMTMMGVITAPAVVFASGVLGAILSIVGGIISLILARNHGVRLSNVRGVLYGVTAWSFGDPRPPLPNAIREALKNTGVPGDIRFYEQGWNDAVGQAFQYMDNYVQQNGLDKAAAQEVYQALGDFDSKKLALKLMLDVANSRFSGNDRVAFMQPWSEYPHDKERGIPSWYPPGTKYPGL